MAGATMDATFLAVNLLLVAHTSEPVIAFCFINQNIRGLIAKTLADLVIRTNPKFKKGETYGN